MQLWQITLRVPQAHAEIFAAQFDEDALALTVQNPPRQPTAEIAAIYGVQPSDDECRHRLQSAAQAHGLPTPAFVIAALQQEDWLAKVAQATPPRRIGRLIIHGAHAAAPSAPSLHIEAATAFGTGEHPSTQMCLLLLQHVLCRTAPRNALDIGCGSGILALALARLGRRPSRAVDSDAESVRMTRENARKNGLSRYIDAQQASGCQSRQTRRRAPYDLIFANIFARPLMALAADIRASLAPGGSVILAGLLTTQAAMVIAAYRSQRLHLIRHLRQGEWSALLLQKRQA